MALIFSMLCLAIAAENFASATDYCNIRCNDKVHTMCKYSSPRPGKLCREWSSQGLNDDEKKIIVKTHSKGKELIAGGNMMMTWDKELETIAQRWANQCLDHHDDCRDVERFAVTQLLRSSSGKNAPTFMKTIQSWHKDIINLYENFISTFLGSDVMVNRYMQNVWANITKMGCGRIKYKKPNGWTTHSIVCNYGPILKE